MSGDLRSTRARTLRGRVTLIAAAMLMLTGCLSLPTEGGVQEGIEAPPADEGIELVAPGPAEDAEPVDIVRGFVFAAAAGPSDDFAVAREFMTTAGSSQWQPRAGVTIYSDTESLQFEVDPVDASQVTVTAGVTATVDENGVYTEAPPGTEREFTFKLVQIVGDQWRISLLDGGVLMSGVTFGSQYRQMSVYFLSADTEWRLVPEARWVPRSGSDRAAVRSLLAGPSEWLAPGVVTAFPDGTQLALDAVTIEDNLASVALSAEMLNARPGYRALALAQLEATLRQLPQIRGVEITVSGNPLAVAEDAEVLGAPVLDRVPTVLSGGELARVTGGAVVPVNGVAQPEGLAQIALPYEDGPALGLVDSTTLVALATSGDGAVELMNIGSRLLAPSYDIQGWAWTGTAAPEPNGGTLRVVDPVSGDGVDVPSPDLRGARVVALRVSREGARLAYAIRTDDSVRVYVAAIVRDASGRPQSIGAGVAVGSQLSSVLDLVWVDEVQLGVLGAADIDDVPTVLLVGVGGQTVALPSIEGAVSLACGSGQRELYVATSAGDLYGRSGNGWRMVVSEVSDPTFAG